jgi:hypothetical protein
MKGDGTLMLRLLLLYSQNYLLIKIVQSRVINHVIAFLAKHDAKLRVDTLVGSEGAAGDPCVKVDAQNLCFSSFKCSTICSSCQQPEKAQSRQTNGRGVASPHFPHVGSATYTDMNIQARDTQGERHDAPCVALLNEVLHGSVGLSK